MNETFVVAGSCVLVVGAARSGVAAARLLVSKGAQVTLTDLKPVLAEQDELRAAGVALALGEHRSEMFDTADLIVTSPGVPAELDDLVRARRRGVPVIGELELASRWVRGPIVAITGTKGKSTTTTLVGRMLETSGRRVLVGGNIGVPLSSQVEQSTVDTVHVIEASSFQLEATERFHPWIAALLNLSPDHLDRHPSEAAYSAAKARIFVNQDAGDWAVVNVESDAAVAVAATSPAQVRGYALNRRGDAAFFAEGGFIWQRTSEGDTPLVPLDVVRVPGRHTLSNVVAASAISRLAGVESSALEEALEGFTGLEHVMEPVASFEGVRFVNDSKATNIDAAARSIESFDGVVAIIGGRYKGGRFEDLRGPLAAHGRGIVAIGESRARVRAALEGVVTIVDAADLAEAVRLAWALARPDGVVVLAPACSSFDMFVDYADRGRRFKEEVRRLVTDGQAGI